MMTTNFLDAGIQNFQKGDYAEALRLLDRAAQQDPKNAEVQIWRATAFQKTGKTEAAISALSQALNLSTDPEQQHQIRLFLMRLSGDSVLGKPTSELVSSAPEFLVEPVSPLIKTKQQGVSLNQQLLLFVLPTVLLSVLGSGVIQDVNLYQRERNRVNVIRLEYQKTTVNDIQALFEEWESALDTLSVASKWSNCPAARLSE